MSDDDYKLVYSSDGSGKNLAKGKSKKRNFPDIIPSEHCLKLRIEKKGRGGKPVSVIYEVPQNPPYFKKLLKELKTHLACGGKQKENSLEIQGLHLDKIRDFLEKKGFQVKGS